MCDNIQAMKRALISFGVILLVLFIAGGFVAVFQGLEVIDQIFIHIFPIFAPAFEQALKDYLTSAYFIVGVILIVLSSIGVILSVKEKKVLYAIISGLIDIISILSLIFNLASCA